jgi:hypothetical protein
MNGPSHYTKAEELAGHAESLIEAGDVDGLATAWAVVAQVHATLANVAANALGSSGAEARAWADVAGSGSAASPAS